mmetsp:Transcript_12542/g.18191  ORF Transcript_12542/g.18191 Transcript_12542/m.18191 type:complete len:200 (-) Transcript_12542:45-644(-)
MFQLPSLGRVSAKLLHAKLSAMKQNNRYLLGTQPPPCSARSSFSLATLHESRGSQNRQEKEHRCGMYKYRRGMAAVRVLRTGVFRTHRLHCQGLPRLPPRSPRALWTLRLAEEMLDNPSNRIVSLSLWIPGVWPGPSECYNLFIFRIGTVIEDKLGYKPAARTRVGAHRRNSVHRHPLCINFSSKIIDSLSPLRTRFHR